MHQCTKIIAVTIVWPSEILVSSYVEEYMDRNPYQSDFSLLVCNLIIQSTNITTCPVLQQYYYYHTMLHYIYCYLEKVISSCNSLCTKRHNSELVEL